jgi:Fur family transcriptional regulator, ferric uptake regulator
MILIIIIEGGGMARKERALLEGYLREHGQKMTSRRETVLEAFLKLERHVTAEELLEAARRLDPGIGQATVFRTIKLLAEAGLAREACSDEGTRRFEHAYGHEHHDHLVCVECGAIREFKDDGIERGQEAVYAKTGYLPSGHRLELLGVCPVCARKAERGRGSSNAG